MSKQERMIFPAPLERFITELFLAAGMPTGDAAYSAHALVQTNLWGIDSHGVLRMPIYLQRLCTKAVNPRPNLHLCHAAQAMEVWDADNALGFVAGQQAMRRAIELARQFTIGAVGIIQSNHFGAACLYARMAATEGMIGVAMTNVAPNMVMPGASRAVVGNNPFSIAAPSFGLFPFAFDIALSQVAGGKLLLAREKGEKIPLDWATDNAGRPTDDAQAAFAGYLLPLGGHKGFGLALAIELLSGVITGGGFLEHVKNMHKEPDAPSATSHLALAINPLALMSKEAYEARMQEFVQMVKGVPMWDNTKEMLLPGEVEYRKAQERSVQGIPLPLKLYDDLVAWGHKLGVSSPLD